MMNTTGGVVESANSDAFRCQSCGTMLLGGTIHTCGWSPFPTVIAPTEGRGATLMTGLTITVTPLPPVEQRCRLRSALADTFRRETGSGDDIAVDFVED